MKLTTKNTHVTLGMDAINSAHVRNLRQAHGGNDARCPLCGHGPTMPYRNTVGGVVVSGCIDATHTGALVKGSADDRWHNRAWARVQRLAQLQSILALG